MNDPLQEYRAAHSFLMESSDLVFALERSLVEAKATYDLARVDKVRAERALHRHILTNPQQQLELQK